MVKSPLSLATPNEPGRWRVYFDQLKSRSWKTSSGSTFHTRRNVSALVRSEVTFCGSTERVPSTGNEVRAGGYSARANLPASGLRAASKPPGAALTLGRPSAHRRAAVLAHGALTELTRSGPRSLSHVSTYRRSPRVSAPGGRPRCLRPLTQRSCRVDARQSSAGRCFTSGASPHGAPRRRTKSASRRAPGPLNPASARRRGPSINWTVGADGRVAAVGHSAPVAGECAAPEFLRVSSDAPDA
ncbi:unnamed protein product, partial [Iphiclides podalirius]